MPTKKSTSPKKNKPALKKTAWRLRWQKLVKKTIHRPYHVVVARVRDLLSRRPHRSFRRTRRRDYARTLKLPGYWAFTNYVGGVLWRHKRIFIGLVVAYGLLTAVLIGVGSQNTYLQLDEIIQGAGDQILQGDLGELAKAGLLLSAGVTGALNSQPTELQRFYAMLLALLVWLTTVWLLRVILADKQPRLRDGFYNAGAPLVPTFLVSLLLIVQLLPVALAAVAFGAAAQTGLLDGGIEAMLFWSVAALLIALTLYWIVATFMALVIITLPGMYPMRAVSIAGDLVVGRRIRLLLRLFWMMAIVIAVWALVMIPLIMTDAWLKDAFSNLQWLPIVPIALLVLGSSTIVWSSSYVYLLYRKVVDDDAAPA